MTDGYAEPTVSSMEPLLGHSHNQFGPSSHYDPVGPLPIHTSVPRSATINRRQFHTSNMPTTSTWNGRHSAKSQNTIQSGQMMKPKRALLQQQQRLSAVPVTSLDSGHSDNCSSHCSSRESNSFNSSGYASPPLLANTITLDRLRFTHKLGEGEFGEVHLAQVVVDVMPNGEARLPHGATVAVKMLRANASQEAKTSFTSEMSVLGRIHHDRIVQLLGTSVHATGRLCMVVEYGECGDLHTLLDEMKAAVE